MNFFLGVDAGATKTKTAVINGNEEVISEEIAGPANHHQTNSQTVIANLEEGIEKVLNKASLKPEDINFSVLGLAARETESDKEVLDNIAEGLLNNGFKGRIKAISDVEVAFASCIKSDYGVVLISGTGANCFGRGKDGKKAKAGDWGYFLGDQGSGFALGQEALRKVMKGFDGRGEKAILGNLILDKLGFTQPVQLVDWIYKRKEVPVSEVADLAPTVCEAYTKGDRIAKSLVEHLVVEMAFSLESVTHQVGLLGSRFEIGLVGGVFKEQLVIDLLKEKIKETIPGGEIAVAKIEPAVAAAQMAKKEYLERK